MRPAPRAGPLLLGARPLSPDLALLRRLESQLHRGFARGSEMREAGAFRIYLWPQAEPFYRNRALPVAHPPDWAPAVARLVEVFQSAGREPRLEYLAELWPDLAEALEAAGFEREMEAPALVLTAPAVVGDPGVDLLDRRSPGELAAAFMAGAQAVFNIPSAHDEAELNQFRRDIEDGATLAAVRIEDGRPVAGACLIGIGAEAELAGVWTSEGYRRRGYASAVCAGLARRFFAGGGEVIWLSAGGEGSEALYRKLGFVHVGTQLNYALSTPAPTSRPLDIMPGQHH